ncbi:MAG: ABC transporter ATP-binding protein [Finegoldia sp.]|nr:ABC transporter ATP-binding protein [Finegoldia sp.]
MIDIKNLNIHYKNHGKDIWAVRDANLCFDEGKSYGLVGESGSGKTTLAMGMLGLLDENAEVSGTISYKNLNLAGLSKQDFKKYRWTDFSVVFQQSMNSFSPVHKIKETFIDVYRSHRKNASKEEIKKKSDFLLEKFNLDQRVYEMYPHELSGGMLQRLTIILALLLDPKLIILDEATTALDVINERQILQSLVDLEKDFKLLRINISHDISLVYNYCENIVVMYAGHIVEQGNTREVIDAPRHPYTEALLKAFPDYSQKDKRLEGIGGSMPDLSLRPEGCIFYDRCKYRKDICKRQAPKPKTIGDHKYSCHVL